MALFFVRDYLLRQFLLCTANRFDYSLGIDPILSASIQNTFQIGNRGHGGFVFLDAKNADLVRHYEEALGAQFLGIAHPYRMIIDEEAAARLLRIYTFDEE